MPNDIASVTIDGQVVFYRDREVLAVGVAATRFVQAKLRRLHPDESVERIPVETIPRRPDEDLLRACVALDQALVDHAEAEAEERTSLEEALEQARTALESILTDEGATREETLAKEREALEETLVEETSALELALEQARAALDESRDLERDALQASLDGTSAALRRTFQRALRESVRVAPTFRFTDVDDPSSVVAAARLRGLRVQYNHVFFAHGGCCCCDPCCGARGYSGTPLKATPLKATPLKATPGPTSAKPTEKQLLHGLDTEAEVESAVEREASVTVWILDTGLAKQGQQTPLTGRGLAGDEDDEPDANPNDQRVDLAAGHGTFIAGMIEEIAPGCHVTVKKVVESDGSVIESAVADEILQLVQKSSPESLGRTILNLSFGGGVDSSCNPVIADAIATAQEAGVVVVASAGNDASCHPFYPANFPGVVAVGAVDSGGNPAAFTNVGSWVQACALGVDVTSTFFKFPSSDPDHQFNGWAVWSGTSFAAPVVVGAIAQKLTTDGNQLAVDALAEVLDGGTPTPCLGKLIEPERSELLVEAARPVI